MKRYLKLSLTALALVGAGGAHALALSSLVSGGSIAAGSLTFDQFTVYANDDGLGSAMDLSKIDVTSLAPIGLNPGPGLLFTVNDGLFSVTGDGIWNYVNLMFSFRATADATAKIKDNSLRVDGGLTRVENGDQLLGFAINEWADSTAPVMDSATLGYITAEFSDTGGITNFNNTAASTFSEQSTYYFTKDILVWAAQATDSANMTSFEQRFSLQDQGGGPGPGPGPIPEPATLALVVLALAGVGASRRFATA